MLSPTPHLVSLLVALPAAGALLLWTFPRGEHSGARGVGLLVATLELALASYAWWVFPSGESQPQFFESHAWIPAFGASYAVGLDGVAMLLVALTALLVPLCILASGRGASGAPHDAGAVPAGSEASGAVSWRSRDFTALLLLLEAAVIGALCAQDLLLFYCFWEGMLVPAYFLLGIWGGPRRVQATLQFFLYTMAGSMLMLVALLGAASVGHPSGEMSFLYTDVAANLARADLGPIEVLLFAGFAIAFLIKVPLMPLHAWLGETYGQAPLTVTALLSGVMVKVGAYALWRYAMLLFPRAATLAMPLLLCLATVSCLWAAWLAYGQSSLRRIVAYSSVSHMGLVVLGMLAVTPTSTAGSALQMVNHGITTGALFLWIGMLERRYHTSNLAELGGLASQAPWMAVSFVVLALASVGLPGLNGFVGEYLILAGTFAAEGLGVSTPEGAFAQGGIALLLAGSVFSAAYATWLLYSLEGRAWRTPVGRMLRVVGAVGVCALAYALAMVPTEQFAGGLLVRPLVPRTLSSLPFVYPLRLAACACTASVVMAAAYLLRGVQGALFGPVPRGRACRGHVADLTGREVLTLAPLVLLSIALGAFAQPVLDTAMPTLVGGVERFRREAGWPAAEIGAVPASAAPTGGRKNVPSTPPIDPASNCPYLSQPQPAVKGTL